MEIQKKILFEWNNINFTIRKEKEHKILQNLSGNIQSGELLAILGPSGSGKTSFLNVLSNKVKREKRKLCLLLFHQTITITTTKIIIIETN